MGYLLDLGPTSLFNELILKANSKKCLVLGAGQETTLISRFCEDIIGINVSREALARIKQPNVSLVVADAQRIPVKDTYVDFIVCKSTLHHLSNLALSISEINRVSQTGAHILLYEPGILNLVAFFGRRFFPTNIHDPSEKPFNPITLRAVLSKNFEIITEEDFFLIIHVIPILEKMTKSFRNPLLLKSLYNFDAFLCKTFLRNFSWILIFFLRKRI